MKLDSFCFWPPKWGTFRKREKIVDIPAANDAFLKEGILNNVESPSPRDPIVTINVTHADYQAAISGDLMEPEFETRRRLYALLQGLRGRRLADVASAEFDPKGLLAVYETVRCGPRSKYYQVVMYQQFPDGSRAGYAKVVSSKLTQEAASTLRDKCERDRLFDRE